MKDEAEEASSFILHPSSFVEILPQPAALKVVEFPA
jgi:hypothetical protein